MFKRKAGLFLFGRMLIGERRLVALAEIEEFWIGEDEGILKAASTWTAILLGDLIGEPSSAVGLLLGRLVEQLGLDTVGLVPAFDTGIAGEGSECLRVGKEVVST